jgi:hypothetical protein
LTGAGKYVVSQGVKKVQGLRVYPAGRNARWRVEFYSKQVVDLTLLGGFTITINYIFFIILGCVRFFHWSIFLSTQLKLSHQKKWTIDCTNVFFDNVKVSLVNRSSDTILTTGSRAVAFMLVILAKKANLYTGIIDCRSTFLAIRLFRMLFGDHMSCFTNDWWTILLKYHILKGLLFLRNLLGMRDSGNAFSNLLHFNLNYLVLKVDPFLVNLLFKDGY